MYCTDLTKKQKSFFIFSLVFVTILFIFCREQIDSHAPYERRKSTRDCLFSQEKMLRMVVLTRTVHDALNKHGLSHFLLYGSIWGPLRGYKGPLPWDYDVDFGTMYTSDTEMKMQEVIKDLIRHDIQTIKLPSSGLHKFKFKTDILDKDSAVVDLFIFTRTWFGLVRRTGYEPFLLGLHYYLHHTFPYKFVDEKLPTVAFAGREIQTPKGGMEIMKYLYRYNWQEVRKPYGFNCSIRYE